MERKKKMRKRRMRMWRKGRMLRRRTGMANGGQHLSLLRQRQQWGGRGRMIPGGMCQYSPAARDFRTSCGVSEERHGLEVCVKVSV